MLYTFLLTHPSWNKLRVPFQIYFPDKSDWLSTFIEKRTLLPLRLPLPIQPFCKLVQRLLCFTHPLQWRKYPFWRSQLVSVLPLQSSLQMCTFQQTVSFTNSSIWFRVPIRPVDTSWQSNVMNRFWFRLVTDWLNRFVQECLLWFYNQ